MLKEQNVISRLFLGMLLALLVVSFVSIHSEASWKKNTDGTYSYYTSNGKMAVSKWIGKYYVDENGKRLVNTVRKIDGSYYGFNSKGLRCSGYKVLHKKSYYFHKKNGKAEISSWVKINKKYKYFGKDGTMQTNKAIGAYYVDSNGNRVCNKWIKSTYYTSSGKIASGLKKIGKYYYYFDEKTHQKVTSTKKTINKKTYKFDENGKGVLISTNGIPKASASVSSRYYSDPYATDEKLLSAIIYCEAGNQPYNGMLAVGMVIMNRKFSNTFPKTMREVIYQTGQFTPALSGTLGSALKNYTKVNSDSKKAAAEIIELYKDYKAGDKIELEVKDKKIDFSRYLYFMSPSDFASFGLSASKILIKDHVFFKTWK